MGSSRLLAVLALAALCALWLLSEFARQSPPAPADPAPSEGVLRLLDPDGASGSAVPAELAPQILCQRALLRAGTRFVAERLEERRRGVRSYAASERGLRDALDRACAVSVARGPGESVLPAFGGACQGVGGAPGEPLDRGAVLRCARAALGRLVEDEASEPLRPNVVVVMTDDQRWDTLRYMPRVRDWAATGAVEFQNGFVTTSLCCPSRASFLTGRYADSTGVRSNRPPAGGAPAFDASDTFVTRLHEAGYATALYGKYMNATELLDQVPPGWDDWQAFLNDGFNYFEYDLNENGTVAHYGSEEREYATDLLAERALRFVEERAGAPFFLLYAPYAPHFDQDFFQTTPAPRHVGAFASVEPFRPASYREPDVSDKPAYIRDLVPLTWDALEAEGVIDAFRIQQLESLLAVDEAFGALLDRLEELGLGDHTLIVFTSDNGYQWWEHRLSGKNHPYEESIRVPLVVAYPLVAPGARREARLALNLDLAPTILEAAGLPPPPGAGGRSLLALLDGRAPAGGWREDFYGEHWELDPNPIRPLFPDSTNTFLRSEDWKYIENGWHFIELYDLRNDPLELENRAFEPETVDVMRAMFSRLRVLRAAGSAAPPQGAVERSPTEPRTRAGMP